jgi:hypothetical protein
MLVAKGIGVIVTTSDFAKMKPYLELCMRSLAQQQGVDFEVVLSCLSNDRQTVEIPTGWPDRLTVVHTPDNRLDSVGWCTSKARNAGAMRCPREYLLFTDGDCMFPNTALAFVQERMNAGAFVRFAVANSLCEPSQLHEILLELANPKSVPVCGGSHGAVAVSRLVWEACGGYDEEFRGWGGDDQEFFERAIRHSHRVTEDSEAAGIWVLHLKHPAWTKANHDVPGKKRNNDRYWVSTNTKLKTIPVTWGGLAWKQND